ncbi:hypothetical protein ACI75Y_09440 [Capnocytophaga stomatis]|uniref:DUF5041 domain-containing protein n=1 Tax=Capnocytophaga stomatis TaxID=1848904 RepID=A0A250FW24_9FLAO|nr:hypothetical protein [Capnocytophaga stomatis]ATA89264.1 hypothetical protein CGC58_05710 [Capnocytophaga stomatis]
MKILITLIFCVCVNFMQAQINPSSLFLVIQNGDKMIKKESRKIRIDSNPNEFYTEEIKYFKNHQEIRFSYPNGTFSDFYEAHYANETLNWQVTFRHSHIDDEKSANNYILLLPKSMFKSYTRKGNVHNFKDLERKWDVINIADFSVKMRTNHSEYVYRHLFNGKFSETIRYNIFIVFSSDLEKDYIPCYEVDVLISTIEEE